MKNLFALFLVLSFFFFACGKKDTTTTTTDTKKETPQTETKQEPTPTTTTSSDLKLPADFPLENEVFKKGVISAVSESGGLRTVTFKPDGLPDDIASVIDKELSKKGFKKDKDEKSDMLTELAWSTDTKRIEADIQFTNGKMIMVGISYEPGK
jgi:hypothetical protein